MPMTNKRVYSSRQYFHCQSNEIAGFFFNVTPIFNAANEQLSSPRDLQYKIWCRPVLQVKSKISTFSGFGGKITARGTLTGSLDASLPSWWSYRKKVNGLNPKSRGQHQHSRLNNPIIHLWGIRSHSSCSCRSLCGTYIRTWILDGFPVKGNQDPLLHKAVGVRRWCWVIFDVELIERGDFLEKIALTFF